ncbi:MAG: hypothetical protein IMF12_02790 [Proteobacteria bacterium]|nr:hypothetical protein [Pseudomonadota bacterium]
MDYVKSTKGTHVYGDCTEQTPVPTLYIKRSALPVDYPKSIKVMISDDS